MSVLDYWKPMFHYFLDGFLGKNDPGALIDNVIRFLNVNNIYKFNSDTNLKMINIDEIINKLNDLNNSILTLGLDSHATSLLFYIIGNDLFILSINSGLGIIKHKQYNKNNNILYSPFFCVKIKNYISEKRSKHNTSETNHTKKRNKNEKFKLLPSKHSKLESESETESKKIKYNTDVLIKIIKFSQLYQEIENYKFNQTKEIINKIKLYAEYLNLTEIINFFNSDDTNDIINYINNYTKTKFYILFINYLTNTLNLTDETDEFNILLNKKNKNLNTKYTKLNKRLYLKNRLYLLNNSKETGPQTNKIENFKLYIYSQEDGSCTFYSLYWAILINSLYNHDYDHYTRMITHFETEMVKICNKEFIPYILSKSNDEYFNYPTISTILNKLSNLNVINKTIFNNYLDTFLYDKISLSVYTSDKCIDCTNDLYNKIYNNSDIYSILLQPHKLDSDEFNTDIFLNIYLYFLNNTDDSIFNIKDYKDTDFTNLYDNPTIKTLINNIKYFTDKLKKYKSNYKSEEYLDINTIRYYYIAKSIINFHINYVDPNIEYNIIKFCHFIYKFYLFYMLFLNYIFYKLSDNIKTESINLDYNILQDYFLNLNINDKNDIIMYILTKITNKKLDKIDKDKLTRPNIYAIDNFYYDLNKDKYYLDGFTINFNFPPPTNDNIKKLELMQYPLVQLESITLFLYDNPRYLYNDFNNNYLFNKNYFVETNLIDILKTDKHKNNLDKYYRDLFYNAIKQNKSNDEIYYFGKKILLLNNYKLLSNPYDFRKNSNSKDKEEKLIKNLINEASKSKFSEFKLENDDIYTILLQYDYDYREFKIIRKMQIHFSFLFNTDNAYTLFNIKDNNIYIFYENYHLIIHLNKIIDPDAYDQDTEETGIYDPDVYDNNMNEPNTDESKTDINVYDPDAYDQDTEETGMKKMYEPEYDNIMNEPNTDESITVTEEYDPEEVIPEYSFLGQYSITKIIIKHLGKEYTALKRNEINHPFKYFIPSACLSLIYEKDGQYNVLCVASKFNNSEYYKLFGTLILSNTPDIIYNYRVDLSNLLTISIDKDTDELNKLSYFIKNYGVNNLNYIYLKEWDEKGIQKININDFNLLCYFNSSNNKYNYHEKYNNKDTNLIQFVKKEYSNKSKDIEMDDIDININFTNDKYKKIIDLRNLIKLNKYSDLVIDVKKKDESTIDTELNLSLDVKKKDESTIDTELDLSLDVKKKDELDASFNNLVFKLSSCSIDNISKIYSTVTQFNESIEHKINELYKKIQIDIINNIPLLDLINTQDNIINYTYLNNIHNISKDILSNPSINNEHLCSKLKTYINFKLRKNKFIYIFEYLFEFILGINVYDEQYYRYINIIKDHDGQYNNYNSIITNKTYNPKYFEPKKGISLNLILKGGGYKNYPLHHIMMGKGKSSVLTPLLSLYFCLIKNKKVFIIVPPHLVKQTEKTFNNIINIFELKDNIIIKSDEDIKNDYLTETTIYKQKKYNENLIFLIDEFDTILDPLKSEFNLTKQEFKKKIDDNNVIKNINKIIKTFIISKKDTLTKDDIVNYTKLKNHDLIVSEINNVLLNINDNKLKYNINWGIHPDKGYAIPYMNKDTPFLNSNFNSIFLTLVLTYYYYYIILYRSGKLTFDENFVNIIINYDFKHDIEKRISRVLSDSIKILCNELNNEVDTQKEDILNNLIIKIIDSIEISEHQYNISFIDIINIPNVYKIGYSGTLNIELPEEINNSDKFKKDKITGDLDENFNVYYSLLVNNVLIVTKDEEKELNKDSKLFINNFSDITNYDAIIDTAGLFRYESNEHIAISLYNKIDRPIIYLNNNDDILVLDKDGNQKYDSNKLYTKPFFYYSQKHTIGIDIKQDNYPILNGLCLIDKLNTYTEVAQSVFRLRKLNQGHTIQLFSINNIIIPTCKTIIDILLENDNNNKKLKIPKLSLQTIKANIRTELEFTNVERYKEKVKYFFNEPNYENITNNDEILKYIFNKQDLDVNDSVDMTYHEPDEQISNLINNQNKLIRIINLPNKDDNNINLKNLVYNVNSSSYTTTKDTSIQIVQNNLTQNKDFKNNDLLDVDYTTNSHNYMLNNSNKTNRLKYYVIKKNNNILQYNPYVLTTLFTDDEKNNCYFTPLLLVVNKNDNKKITIIPSTDIYLYNNENYTFLNCSGYKLKQNNIDISNHTLKNYITNYYSYQYSDCEKLFNHRVYKHIFNILAKINGSNKVTSNKNINKLLDTIRKENVKSNNIYDDNSEFKIEKYSIVDINPIYMKH